MARIDFDHDGNRFQVGNTYEYHDHHLKLLRIISEDQGRFVLVESYGALRKDEEFTLSYSTRFKCILSEPIETNKEAKKLLSEEW